MEVWCSHKCWCKKNLMLGPWGGLAGDFWAHKRLLGEHVMLVALPVSTGGRQGRVPRTIGPLERSSLRLPSGEPSVKCGFGENRTWIWEVLCHEPVVLLASFSSHSGSAKKPWGLASWGLSEPSCGPWGFSQKSQLPLVGDRFGKWKYWVNSTLRQMSRFMI